MMKEESSDSVVVHPLLVDKMEVIIMPEVTRVLRMVFQVLSQPNYYLSKSGISSKRLSGPHLMKLKILGIVNNDVKVCSYITRDEALDIFKSFSSTNTNQYLSRIVWGKTIDVENEAVEYVKSLVVQKALKPELTYFIHEGKSMVPWMGFLKLLSCDNINCDKLTDEFVETLQSTLVFKVLEDQMLYNYLTKIRKIHHFGNDLKYVSIEEILDVLIRIGISVTSLPVVRETNKIRLLPPIYLDKNQYERTEEKNKQLYGNSEAQVSSTLPSHVSTKRSSLKPGENIELSSNEIQQQLKSDSMLNSSVPNKSPNGTTVFVYEVNGALVVALPDIHKIIRRAQNLVASNAGAKSAQQRQVNYYLTKMRCKKGRFSFMQLKTIRKIGTPLGNATYCTYINKEDAINLFKIYASLNMEYPEVFHSVNFSEPISLGLENILDINGVNEYTSCYDPTQYASSIDSDHFNRAINKKDILLPERNPMQYETDRELFRKYENTKVRLKRLESHMAIISKYYKWKMRHLSRTNRCLKTKWRCLCRILDSIESDNEPLFVEDVIYAQNGNIQN